MEKQLQLTSLSFECLQSKIVLGCVPSRGRSLFVVLSSSSFVLTNPSPSRHQMHVLRLIPMARLVSRREGLSPHPQSELEIYMRFSVQWLEPMKADQPCVCVFPPPPPRKAAYDAGINSVFSEDLRCCFSAFPFHSLTAIALLLLPAWDTANIYSNVRPFRFYPTLAQWPNS